MIFCFLVLRIDLRFVNLENPPLPPTSDPVVPFEPSQLHLFTGLQFSAVADVIASLRAHCATDGRLSFPRFEASLLPFVKTPPTPGVSVQLNEHPHRYGSGLRALYRVFRQPVNIQTVAAGVALLVHDPTSFHTMQVVFEVYDFDGDGCVRRGCALSL